jgi:hypothetical protein
MSNKYLEKVASLFPSKEYKKTLSGKERRDYDVEYATAGGASLKNFGKSLLGIGVVGLGAGLGHHAGATLGSKIGAKIGAKQGKKFGAEAYRTLMAGGKTPEREAKGFAVYAHDMIKQKTQNTGRAMGGVAGAAVGIIPGAAYADNFRHNHAKSVIEKRRKQND